MAHQMRPAERDMLSTDCGSRRLTTEDESDLDQQPPSPAERLIPSDLHARNSEATSHALETYANPESVDNNGDAGYESVTDTSCNGSKYHDADFSRTYKPWSLRRDTLLGILMILLAMIIALELLYRVSNRNNGLATASENERYLWRYGPTAGE